MIKLDLLRCDFFIKEVAMYKSTKIKDDIVWIGVNDRKIEKWESHIPLDFGVTYNSLKVKGNGVKSDSGNLVSVPLYLIFGTGTDNGIYTKLSAGFAVRNGSVKWTDNNGGSGKIKARPLTGYAAFGIGVRKDRFSIGVSASTSTKAKRTYSSPTKHYRDNIMLSGAAISLDFGYALKYE